MLIAVGALAAFLTYVVAVACNLEHVEVEVDQ